VGRHSSSSRWPYVRSVMAYAVPWLLVATIVGLVVWVAVGAVGGEPISVGDASSRTSPSPRPSSRATSAPEATQLGEGPGRNARGRGSKDDLITKDISVQVLNGTGGVEGAAEAMANRLAKLGYKIYAINTGLTIDRTTVYWSTSEGRPAAISLAAYFGWDVRIAPSSLSGEVDVAVVVGSDDV
jgi:hypothetical protein